MENATKALIIAGGMLIAMLIVGLLTWGYTQLRSLRQTNVEEEERHFRHLINSTCRQSIKNVTYSSMWGAVVISVCITDTREH